MKRVVFASVYYLILLGLWGCTIQQRHYRKGFYLDIKTYHASIKSAERDTFLNSDLRNAHNNAHIQTLQAFGSDFLVPQKKETVCDTVYQANGVKMIVKVTKIYKDKTYYKLCDSDNEAEFTIETTQLKKVVFANGKTDSLQTKENDPYDYYRKQREAWPNYDRPKTNSEIERGVDLANESLYFLLGGIIFLPLVIVSLYKSTKAIKILQGKRGYEKEYNKAQIVQGCSIGCTAILAIYLILMLVILVLLFI